VISDGFSPAGQAKPIPGATVEYTITVRNDGLPTTGATMAETIPANTTYVPGSTTLNGAAVADIAGAMPFVGGGAINSPAAAAGVLNTWTSDAADNAVVRFQVTIN
jgi:large repetitive protein